MMKNIIFTTLVVVIFINHAIGQTYAEKLGYPKGAKVIILHVDDVGMSYESNDGAIQSIEKGVATSLSMMMPCSWIPGFLPYLKDHPRTDAGLHLTLTSEWNQYRWGPLAGKTNVPGLVDKEGAMWKSVAEVVQHASADEIYTEIKSQLDRSRTAGWEPTHLDSHMGTLFATPEFLKMYLMLGINEKIPVMFPGGHNTMILESEKNTHLDKKETTEVGKMLWNAGLPVLDDLHNVTYGFSYPQDVSNEELQKFAANQYIESFKKLQPGLTMVIMHCSNPSPIFKQITESGTTRKADMLAMLSPELKKYIQDNQIILTTWREAMERRKRITP